MKDNNLSNSLWFKHIYDMKIKFQSSIKEIESYLFKLEVDIDKSNVLLENNTLEKAIFKGVSYIKKSLIQGQWCDYYNQGGISNIWSTSFVLSKIVSDVNFKEYFEKEINLASDFILSSMSRNNMWGYNSTWIEDADSTNFALISLWFLNKLDNFDYKNWVSHFKSSFFTTYCDSNFLKVSLADKNINNVDGWCSDHYCVSAVSLYFLTISNRYPHIKNKLLENFKSISVKDIKSYWWSSNIYTLYYLFLSYKELGFKEEIEIIQNYVSINIKKGFYEDSYGKNLFYTALALEILLFNLKFKELTIKLVNNLVDSQFDDGSWLESNSLCIPKPNELKPTNENYNIQDFGVGVRSHEFNRLFTSVAVLKSLYLWKNQN